MNKIILASLLVALIQPLWAADLSLLLTHDSTSLSADGVTRTSHYQERLYRQQQQVWLERIIPAHVAASVSHDDSDGHKHLDLDTSARWVSRIDDKKAEIRLVNRHDRQLVTVDSGDYDAIGFDGDWPTAYYLVDPAKLKTMILSKRSAPAGSQWYESIGKNGYIRILWDSRQQYPRRIESGSHDGSQERVVRVEPGVKPAQMPWLTLKGYQHKEYTDFMD